MMGGRRMILIAGESRQEREALATALRCRGYSVAEAQDGEEALHRVGEDPPDLVLLGGVLPGRTGIEVCAAIKRDDRTRAIPVILLTSITRTTGGTDEAWRRRTGADAFLSKPYPPRNLYWMIDSLLDPRDTPVR
jgi:twitching motility two-component system response regulator PilH